LVSTDETPLPTLTLKSGLMHFRDAESLRSELEKISQMDSANYASWKSNFSGFVSLQDRYNQLLKQALEDETVLEVDLEQLVREHNLPYYERLAYSKVLSEDGLVVIANKLHVIREGKEFVLDFSQANLASAQQATDEQLPNLSLSMHEVRNQFEQKKRKWVGSSLDKVTPYPQNTNLSAHLRGFSYQFSTHVEIGASMTGRKYKKNCGLCSWKWQNDNMWYAEVDGNFWAYDANTQQTSQYFLSDPRPNVDFVGDSEILPPGSYIVDAPGGSFYGAALLVTYTYEDDGYPRISMFRVYN